MPGTSGRGFDVEDARGALSHPRPTCFDVPRVTVHQDAHHPSHVEIPVIGEVAAKKLGGRQSG